VEVAVSDADASAQHGHHDSMMEWLLALELATGNVLFQFQRTGVLTALKGNALGTLLVDPHDISQLRPIMCCRPMLLSSTMCQNSVQLSATQALN
jgi:hypothetical protein